MYDNSPEIHLGQLIKQVSALLQPLGFKRNGMSFSFTDRNTAILQFQKSQSNSADTLKFTINIGVVCRELLPQERRDIKRPSVMDAHLRQRIGHLLPGGLDKWWEITKTDGFEALELEIQSAIRDYAIPYLMKNISTKTLIELWQSGESPGLTEVQKNRYLQQLTQLETRAL